MIQKLNSILVGWKNFIFESKEIESMAKGRAMECAKCDNSVWGLIPAMLDDEIKDIKGLKCNLCECPLSTKLRSAGEVCPLGKWQKQ